MAESLPALFNRVENLKLNKSFVGLKGIRFVEKPERGSTTLSYYDRFNDTISIYPMSFRSGSRIDLTFYMGLGMRHWELNIPSNLKCLWKQKLIQPNMSTMDRLVGYIKNGISNYKELLDKFYSAVDRLQVLHVINTLVDNRVKPNEAKGVDLFEYPPTEGFCKGLTPFSLIPLLSAYRGGSGLPMEAYEDAFAEYCSENGKVRASEQSVEWELIELFKFVSDV